MSSKSDIVEEVEPDAEAATMEQMLAENIAIIKEALPNATDVQCKLINFPKYRKTVMKLIAAFPQNVNSNVAYFYDVKLGRPAKLPFSDKTNGGKINGQLVHDFKPDLSKDAHFSFPFRKHKDDLTWHTKPIYNRKSEEQIKKAYETRCLAFATGKINDMVVIDLDLPKKEGEKSGILEACQLLNIDSVEELAKYGCHIIKTGSGGYHVICKYSDKWIVSNSKRLTINGAEFPMSCIDVRTDGGCMFFNKEFNEIVYYHKGELQCTLLDELEMRLLKYKQQEEDKKCAVIPDLIKKDVKAEPVASKPKDAKVTTTTIYPADTYDEKVIKIKKILEVLADGGYNDEGHYDDWRDVGMAIKNELGDDDLAFSLFDDFSKGGDCYKGSSETRAKWNTFAVKADGKKIGSLVQMAREIDENFKAIIPREPTTSASDNKKRQKTYEFFDDVFAKMREMVGKNQMQFDITKDVYLNGFGSFLLDAELSYRDMNVDEDFIERMCQFIIDTVRYVTCEASHYVVKTFTLLGEKQEVVPQLKRVSSKVNPFTVQSPLHIMYKDQRIGVFFAHILDSIQKFNSFAIFGFFPFNVKKGQRNSEILNSFHGFVYEYCLPEDRPQCLPKHMMMVSVIEQILDLVRSTITGTDEQYDYVLSYFAHILQRPWSKTQKMLIFIGEKGIGKSTFIDYYCREILGWDYVYTASDLETITSVFNADSVEGKLVNVVDDTSNTTKSQTEITGILKTRATADVVVVAEKYEKARKATNYSNVIILSNSIEFIRSIPGDRRPVFLDTQTTYLGNTEYWNRMYGEGNGVLYNKEIAQYFFHYLMDYKYVNDLQCRTPPPSETMKKVQEESLPQAVASYRYLYQYLLYHSVPHNLPINPFNNSAVINLPVKKIDATLRVKLLHQLSQDELTCVKDESVQYYRIGVADYSLYYKQYCELFNPGLHLGCAKNVKKALQAVNHDFFTNTKAVHYLPNDGNGASLTIAVPIIEKFQTSEFNEESEHYADVVELYNEKCRIENERRED